MTNKKIVLRDDPLISGYLHALNIGNDNLQNQLLNSILKSNPSIVEISSGVKYNDVGPYILYQIIELSGLDFRFEFRTYRMINGKLKSTRLSFIYKNGKIKFTGKNNIFPLKFCNSMRKYGLDTILDIRIPNLKDYIWDGSQLFNNLFGQFEVNSDINFTVLQRIKSSMFKEQGKISWPLVTKFSHAIFDILFTNGYKIDLNMSLIDFDSDVDKAIDNYYENENKYNTDEFPLRMVRLLKKNKWELLTDRIELRTLYLRGLRTKNAVFFIKNNECIMLVAKQNSIKLFRTVTHIKPTSCLLYTSPSPRDS